MKIIEKSNQLVEFADVKIAEVIRINGRYYIRILTTESAIGEPLNVVDLDNGYLNSFDPTAIVEKVECELVIK